MDDDSNKVLLALHGRLGGTSNLYAVQDRQGTITFIVAAQNAGHACELIRETVGMDWSLATTHSRRVLRNVDCQPQVLTAVGMQARTNFRRITGRSKEAANRRRQRKNNLILAQSRD
jgi:hypothetical protein